MESRFKEIFSLREGESPLFAVERIRSHPHFPYLNELDIQNLVRFLNKTSFKYSKLISNMNYIYYLFHIIYYCLHMLPVELEKFICME